MAAKDIYHVWRRNDGYVNATNGFHPTSQGSYTFERLLTTEEWEEAASLIQAERSR